MQRWRTEARSVERMWEKIVLVFGVRLQTLISHSLMDGSSRGGPPLSQLSTNHENNGRTEGKEKPYHK